MMAKPKRKRSRRAAPQLQPATLPTPEQLASGDFDRDFVTHAETATKVMTHRRRDSSMVERWIRDDPGVFGQPAQRVIADCVLLWSRMGEPRVVALYGERMAPSTHDDGMSQHQAMKTLAEYRAMLGPHMRHYWACFENVLRHNEPAGISGSRFAKNEPQRIQSAKVIVGMVANSLAGKLGY